MCFFAFFQVCPVQGSVIESSHVEATVSTDRDSCKSAFSSASCTTVSAVDNSSSSQPCTSCTASCTAASGAVTSSSSQPSSSQPSSSCSSTASSPESGDPSPSLRSTGSSRFSSPVSDVEVESLQKRGVPKNTSKDTAWSYKVFKDWQEHRNADIPLGDHAKRVPDLSSDLSEDKLNFWLIRFVMEANRKDGTPYPAITLKHLCIGIQRYLRTVCNRPEISLFDSPTFAAFRRTLDSKMKELNKMGVHLHKKQAEPLTHEHENILWETGVFNLISGRGLQNAVYFYTSKVYGLRAVDEHYNLTCEQFVFGSDTIGSFIKYEGRVCKNNQGGLATSGRVQFKNIKQYSQMDNPRCYVKMMTLYLQALGHEGWFYRRPLASTFTGDLRYSKQRLGIHQFESYMQRLAGEAGIQGYFTGHSGKVIICAFLSKEIPF